MPHKFNAQRRDKIPKQKHRMTNWASYNESLRRRGDLTVWVSEEARRYCQTNANSSQFSSNRNLLGCAEVTLLGQSGGTVQLEIVSAIERALLVEIIVDGGMNGGEFL
jgi:hypothetical protein